MDESSKPPSHREFMRARRPHLFSDTLQVEVSDMDRRQFEFHLHSLTSRKEETAFENFARALAQRELCPNLIPQTGPTGGGDSKVDTETYPVAPELATLWYEGEPAAASERWAFAVSAKADWKPKLKSDVAKIVGTSRHYARIYFVSNQAIRDKDRAELEDALTQEHGVPVRILDRSWIVAKVLENRRWELVAETLQFELSKKLVVRPGPLDTERQLELESLDRQIDEGAGRELTLAVIEKALQSALLARGLGRPRVEVDGRFDRAERLARSISSSRQLTRIWYQRAWTAMFWFNDLEEAARLYDAIAAEVLGSEWVWDVEDLVNLWVALQTGKPPDEARTAALRAALERHAGETVKSTSSLWARAQLLLMDLVAGMRSRGDLQPTFAALRAVFTEVRHHVEFPIEPLVRIVREMVDVIGDLPGYDELLDAVIEIEQERNGERAAGELRLQRGLQKLQNKKPYEAIDDLAKSQLLLAQEDSRDEFIAAVCGTGLAYESAGLLYASRANLVSALDRCLYGWFKGASVDRRALPVLKKLAWLELQLGRVPYVLAWVKWLPAMRVALSLEPEELSALDAELQAIDRVLGILILRTPHEQWTSLTRLPDSLSKLGLEMSRAAALFMLGHEDTVKEHYGAEGDDLNQFATEWLAAPAAQDLPAHPSWHTGSTTMSTVLLGCRIDVVARGGVTSALLGESIIAFLEAFFSTAARVRGLLSPREDLVIEVRQSETAKTPFSMRHMEDEYGESKIVVTHPVVAAADLLDKGFEVPLLELFGRIIFEMQLNIERSELETMFSTHRAQDRALNAARSIIPLTNVLGAVPSGRAEDWVGDESLADYPLLRQAAWTPASLQPASDAKTSEDSSQADGRPSETRFGADALLHRDIKALSPINIPVWTKAGWKATGVLLHEDATGQVVPGMGLAFEDIDAGRKIFRGWRKKVGRQNTGNWVGVTVVTGIDREKPLAYRVVIGVSDSYLKASMSEGKMLTLVYSKLDMNPVSTQSLQLLREHYARAGRLVLTPAPLRALQTGSAMTREDEELGIELANLTFVEAWQIEPDSPLITATTGIENPVVPPGVADVPFVRTLARLRSMKSSR